MYALWIVLPVVVLSGCYTPIWMGKGETNVALERGMVVYLPKRSIVTYRFTQYVDEATKQLVDPCTPVEFHELAMLPDTKTPYRLSLWQPWIGSSESGITLADGVVTGVTQKADTKIPETITAIGELVSKVATVGVAKDGAKAGVATGKRGCNTGKKVFEIDGVRVLPKP